MSIPRVAAIHDLSGVGRCSLTVALPILSAMRVQCCPLPTALLSTHTGGFKGYTFLDLTDEMEKISAHWRSLGLQFDAIYTGFLGSEAQVSVVEEFLYNFYRPETLVVVDPVMGDNGVLYRTYTPAMCDAMARLAEKADVITPNMTEAALLMGVPYETLPEPRVIVEKLNRGGKRSVVLTGVSLSPGMTGAMCFDSKTGRTEAVQTDFVVHPFHGTGDVFASVLTGALVGGAALVRAAELAAQFVRVCAEHTGLLNVPLREGVEFEPFLGLLAEQTW